MVPKDINYNSNNNDADTTYNISSDSIVEENNTQPITTNNNDNTYTEEYSEVPNGCEEYIAKKGDTLESIANANNTTVDKLRSINIGINEYLSEGDIIYIPMEELKMGGSETTGNNSGNEGSSINSDQSTPNLSNSDSGRYSETTSDLRNLNLDDFQEIYDNYEFQLEELLSKYNYTPEEFDRIYSLAKEWGLENGFSINEPDNMSYVLELFLYEHQEYETIDYADIEEIVSTKYLVDTIKESYSLEEEYVDYNYKDNYYDEIINDILLEIGYKDSEIEELTTLDILKIYNDNKDKIEELIKKEINLPDDYDIENIIKAYIVNHYINLVPNDEKFNIDETLEKYQEEAIDILSQIGYIQEDLTKMNIYELIKELGNNTDKINTMFINQGIDLTAEEFSFNSIFTNFLANIAYYAALDNKSMFIDYVNAGKYKEETKIKAINYYEEGNINSALYSLRLEELKLEKEDNNIQIEDYNSQLKDIILNDPDYCVQYTNEKSIDAIATYMINAGNKEVKELYTEKKKIQESNNKIDLQIYRTNQSIKLGEYQYLDLLEETDEYNNSSGVISYNEDFINELNVYINNNQPIDIESIHLNNLSLTNDLMNLETAINNIALESDFDDISDFIEGEYYVLSSGTTNRIDSVIKSDNEIIVRVSHNNSYINVKYDITNDKYTYEFEKDNNIYLTTDNLEDYTNINYFELFKYIESLDKFKDMSKEEIFNEVFGPTDEMSDYDNPIEVAKMCYLNFTEEEIKDYNYLFNTKGAKEAQNYLEIKRDTVHQKIGMQAALDDLDYIMSGNKTFRTGIVGLQNGVQGWTDNVYTFFTKDTTMTSTEYESEYLLSILTSFATKLDQNDENLDKQILGKIENLEEATLLDYYYATGEITEEQYNNIKNNEDYKELEQYVESHPAKLKYSYMIGQNVGNMLPSVLGSLLLSPIGSISLAGHTLYAGQAAASLLMYAGAYGGSYKEAVRKGKELGAANLYATLNALSEVATEYFLGRIPGVARISNSLNSVIYQNVWQLLGIHGINLLKDVTGEIFEESVQIWIDYILNKSILGEEIDISKWPAEQRDTIIVTTFTTLILGLPANIATLTTDVANGPVIKLNDNEELKLSFKDILRLNKEYVNSETGEIDMDGLINELDKIMNKETALDVATIKELSTDESKVKEGRKLENIEEKKEIIKSLSYGDAISFSTDENGNNTIVINESIINKNTDIKNKVYQLHALIPDEDISYSNGTLLYNAKYDVLNYIELEVEIPSTGNKETDILLNENIMDKIQTMEEENKTTLYDANDMPLSNREEVRKIQEKYLRGEPLSFSDKMNLGRDNVYRSIDNVEFKTDCAYRVISDEVFNAYQEEGKIFSPYDNDEYQEYEEDGKIYNNNRGIDWYLAGVAPKYSNVNKGIIILECPADQTYFQPAYDNGSGMTLDPFVRHMKSSGSLNPIPIDMISRAFRLTIDEEGNYKIQEIEIDKSNSPTTTKEDIANDKIGSYVQSYKNAWSEVLTQEEYYYEDEGAFLSLFKKNTNTNNKLSFKEWSKKVDNAKYQKEVEGILFTSNTKAGLNNLINYYIDSRNSSDINGEYFNSVLSKKGLTITDIPNKEGRRSYHLMGIIYFDNDTIYKNAPETFFHECGHFLDYYSSNQEKKAFLNTITELDNNPYFDIKESINKFKKKYDSIEYNVMRKESAVRRNAESWLRNNDPNWNNYTRSQQRHLINEETNNELETIYEIEMQKNGLVAVSDIFDALTNGEWQESAEVYGHGREYYSRTNTKYKEILANISSLYNSNNLDMLYDYFPKSFVDNLIQSYENLLEIQEVSKELNEIALFINPSLEERNYSYDMKILSMCYSDEYFDMDEETKLKIERYITTYSVSNKLLMELENYYDSTFGRGALKEILNYYLTYKQIPPWAKKGYKGYENNLSNLLTNLSNNRIRQYIKRG